MISKAKFLRRFRRLLFLLFWLLLASGCARKEFFYFSGPAANTRAALKPLQPDSVETQGIGEGRMSPAVSANPASPVWASAGTPVPVLKPVYAQAVLQPALPQKSTALAAAPLVKQKRAGTPPLAKGVPEKPAQKSARAGLLLGSLSLVLAIAGLSSLTHGGVILLFLAMLTSLTGIFFSVRPKAWNKKHPDNAVSTKGANIGLGLSMAALSLIAFFAILVIALF